jgi:hypothetical protein
MAGKVYFGNATKQTWIVAPQTGLKSTSSGFQAVSQLLSGRQFVKRSRGASRNFNASWIGSMNDSDMTNSLHTIKDFADGIYGAGPHYWLDPFAMASNLMPPHWAAPMLGESEWPDLVSNIAPTFTAATYANDYPIKYATYALTASYVGDRKITIIIPATHTLNFGWHSTTAGTVASSAAGVRVKLYNRSTGATTDTNPASLLAGGTTRTNTTVDGATYNKVEIFLANGSGSTSSATIVGMIAQVLLTGTSVTTGGFITGRGTSAIEFSGPVELEYYTSAIQNGQIGLATNFTEVD